MIETITEAAKIKVLLAVLSLLFLGEYIPEPRNKHN
jgi:hypothetical protein